MKRRLLVIEDVAEVRHLLREALEPMGFEIVEATNGRAGVLQAQQASFEAILLDLLMPEMHGFEVISALRASERHRTTPIIVLTSKSFANDHRTAIELGANAVLLKPLDLDELSSTLDRLRWSTRVQFWGVRGSIAAPGPETVRYGGNTPCVTVEHAGQMLILDAGTGLRRLGQSLMAQADGRPQTLQMLISHTHWDHIQGFPFFVPAYLPSTKMRIWGPRSTHKPLERVLRGQQDPEYFPVALGDMAAQIEVNELRGAPFEVGPFKVTTCYMNHPGITLGFRIEVEGCTIAYATDTEPYRTLLARARPSGGEEYGRKEDASLLALVQGADLYIADSQYTPEEYPAKLGWGHTCYLDALEVALAADVKHLALFSHDPMHDDDAVDAKVNHCRRVAAERGSAMAITGAAEGLDLTFR